MSSNHQAVRDQDIKPSVLPSRGVEKTTGGGAL